MIRELSIPPDTEGDDNATEMIRVWLAHDDVHVSLLLGMWEDADDCDIDEGEAWGNLLADVARHVANGMEQSHAWERLDTLRRIKQAFLGSVLIQSMERLNENRPWRTWRFRSVESRDVTLRTDVSTRLTMPMLAAGTA